MSSVSYKENSHAFRNGHGITLHKGVFCAAASIFIRWLKFLQLKTSHPLVESLVLGFFGLKICSKLCIFTRIKKAVLHSFTRM